MSNGNAKRKAAFFTYSTGRLAAIAAGAVVNTFINIQADSDFIVEKLTYGADIAGAVANVGNYPAPNILVLLTSTGAGVNLMNNPIPLVSMFGLGELPFILPYPMALPANSQLQIQLTSVEAASTPSLALNFIGRKLYLLQSAG